MKRNALKIDLAKYSKQELVEILKEVIFLADPFQRNEYLERALIEVNHKRQLRLIDESAKHADLAHKARREAIELLKPYENKKI